MENVDDEIIDVEAEELPEGIEEEIEEEPPVALKTKPGKKKKRTLAEGGIILGPNRSVVYKRFEETVGRESIMLSLSQVDDARANKLVMLMSDPLYRNHTMAKLSMICGLKLNDLRDLFRKGNMDVALMKMFKHVPEILEDTAIDAKSTVKTCWKCRGKKVDDDDQMCLECSGSGQTRVVGDKDARGYVFEIAGLSRRGGPLIAQQFNVTGGSLESIESLVESGQKLLKP